MLSIGPGERAQIRAAFLQQARQRPDTELGVIAREANPLSGGVPVREVVGNVAIYCDSVAGRPRGGGSSARRSRLP